MTTRNTGKPISIKPEDLNRISLLVGWKKDPYDKRDLIRPIRRAGLPEKVDLLSLMPQVRDQGQVGSCVGFGVGANLYAQALIDGLEPGEWFSPTWIYNGARFLEGTLMNDVGCYPRSALKWLGDKGALLEHLWPYNPNRLDTRTPPSDLNPEAARWPVLSYTRVVGGAAGIASALAEGKPVSVGTPWYDKWMFTGPDGKLAAITEQDHPAGGHETVIYGYDALEQVFLFQNSWGTDWAKAGRAKMPMQAFSIFTAHGGYDAYTIDVNWDGTQPPPPKPKRLPDWLTTIFIAAGAIGLYALARISGLIEWLF